MKHILTATALCLTASAGFAQNYGFAGILSNDNRGEMPELQLVVGQPIADGPITLNSGMVYEMEIEADGSAELALTGAEFFRAVWVNEVVVNGLEIRPFGIESVEFDEAGTMEIEFVAIKPGTYELKIPGSTEDSQRVQITIQ